MVRRQLATDGTDDEDNCDKKTCLPVSSTPVLTLKHKVNCESFFRKNCQFASTEPKLCFQSPEVSTVTGYNNESVTSFYTHKLEPCENNVYNNNFTNNNDYIDNFSKILQKKNLNLPSQHFTPNQTLFKNDNNFCIKCLNLNDKVVDKAILDNKI